MLERTERYTDLPSQKKKKNEAENKSKKEKKISKEEKEQKKIVKKVKVLLNGRSGPSKNHEVIKIYQPDTELTIIEEKDGWAKNSENIYVMSEFLK